MNTIDVIPTSEAQPAGQDSYRIFASNLKRSTRPGSLIASVDLHLPDLDLHLNCRVLRDRQGNTYVAMPRVKVEAPDGKIHHKTLARWGTVQSAQRFEAAALRAIHELIAKTEFAPERAKDRDPLSVQRRFAPLLEPAPSLASSASPATDNR